VPAESLSEQWQGAATKDPSLLEKVPVDFGTATESEKYSLSLTHTHTNFWHCY
jgi:hypothetical protein